MILEKAGSHIPAFSISLKFFLKEIEKKYIKE
ncbi:hypothetical protein NRS6084_01572 [Bacillus subtilis]|nr:hypothetical protein NRS6084_01572 [Bacillus subtilis]SIR04128.1 hypothetical protein SAMN05878487_2692 [Bacillus subtilis]